MDQIFIYAKRDLREERVVSIGGWVREPGVYPFVDGMTVRDLVLKAGGLRTGAFLDHAEVSRVVISQTRTDSLTERFQVSLDSSYVVGASASRRSRRDQNGAADNLAAYASPPAPDFSLQSLDAVFIRKAPGFQPQENVIVAGEVLLPGPYTLERRGERLSDLIYRAGGLTSESYPEGLQLWRAEPTSETDTLTAAEIAGRTFGDTLSQEERARLEEAGEVDQRIEREDPGVTRTRVGIDFVQALANPESPQNVLVQPNDSIFVPTYIATVEVTGAVGIATRVLFKGGAGLGYYIDQAGGYAQDADKGRTWVRYANGEVQTRGGKFLFFGGGVPDPDPGSVITVPIKPPKQGGGMRTGELIALLTSVLTASAAIVVAAK